MTRSRIVGLALGLAVLATVITLAVATLPNNATPQTIDQRVHAVAATLRCPVCLNLSVADSPSPVAQEMRARIRAELLAGKSPDAIRAGFVAAYGEWILLSPRPSGVNVLAWTLPPIVLLVAILGVVFVIHRWTVTARPRDGALVPVSSDDQHRLQAEVARLGDRE